MTTPQSHSCTVSLTIAAELSTVFRYFSDPARFARWHGQGSTIGATGSDVRVRFPDGSHAVGKVLSAEQDRKVVFTWGYDKAGSPLPSGSSTVTVLLERIPTGTKVTLTHDGLPTQEFAQQHIGGWKYYTALLASRAAEDQFPDVERIADSFIAAWNERDPAARTKLLESCFAADGSFRDAWGVMSGRDELNMSIAVVHMHDPNSRIERDGPVAHAHGWVHFVWKAVGGRTADRGAGHNVGRLAFDGRLQEVVGMWQR